LHSTVAQNWINADKLNAAYVSDWQKTHAAEVAQWVKDNPGTPAPQPADLAVPFFTDYSKAHPGTFPSAVEHKKPDGKTEKKIEPVKEGSDIQAGFFDMWLQEHPDADLESVPADMVTASGSGLDPDITLSNALWQLDRVAAAWAKKTGTANEKSLHDQIGQLLRDKSYKPMGGLVGVPLVNVLEVNLALRDRYQKTAEAGK
jgi:K+-transporting ATPase ATPase C chain